VQTGDSATSRYVVTDDDTAAAVRSGDLPVLGTPVLLAWCEAVTCAALDQASGGLPSGTTSVGTRVTLDHLAASPVGAVVEVVATVAHVDGRLVRFEVVARETPADGPERLVGHGELTRVVVDRQRFLDRLG
jgi:fluoroacetyl-CoA thioesterase